jgi:predicted Zn-dependent protease
MALVRAGNPADAIALLQPRVDAEQATTRDFYALAEAYAATGDRSAAARAAARALGAPDARGALTAAEIERLQSLSGRRYR